MCAGCSGRVATGGGFGDILTIGGSGADHVGGICKRKGIS